MKIEPGPAPVAIRGFRFSGVHGGIKKKGRRDFALIVADHPCTGAAVFTRNRCVAAPVVVAREHATGGHLQAIMVNSGNANCATGEQGLKLVRWSCEELAGRLGIAPQLVLPCSTGVIGVQLDRRVMAKAIALGVDSLSRRGFTAAARAILTSDAFPKWAWRTLRVEDTEITVAAMAKGAGMIEPNMATMLAFVLTDAKVSTEASAEMLRSAVAGSLNRITVDGDTSTNDTCVLLASGAAAGSGIEGRHSSGYEAMTEAVGAVLDEVSRMIVRDGEGASKVVDLVVEGARDDREADAVARRIAHSPLFRAALAGADPNWGRIVMALGNSEAAFEIEALEVDVGQTPLVRAGTLVSDEAAVAARRTMKHDAYVLTIRIGGGSGRALLVTSDLTEDYVRFNSAYTS